MIALTDNAARAARHGARACGYAVFAAVVISVFADHAARLGPAVSTPRAPNATVPILHQPPAVDEDALMLVRELNEAGRLARAAHLRPARNFIHAGVDAGSDGESKPALQEALDRFSRRAERAAEALPSPEQAAYLEKIRNQTAAVAEAKTAADLRQAIEDLEATLEALREAAGVEDPNPPLLPD